jgi:hypothetical protein
MNPAAWLQDRSQVVARMAGRRTLAVAPAASRLHGTNHCHQVETDADRDHLGGDQASAVPPVDRASAHDEIVIDGLPVGGRENRTARRCRPDSSSLSTASLAR